MNKEDLLIGVALVAVLGGFYFIYIQTQATNAAVTSLATQSTTSAATLPATSYVSAALPTDDASGNSTADTSSGSGDDDAATVAADSLQASTAATQASLSANLASIQAATTTGLASISASAGVANNATNTNATDDLFSHLSDQFTTDKESQVGPGAVQSIYGYVDTPTGNNTVSFTYTGEGSNVDIYADPTLANSKYNPSINPAAPPIAGASH